MKQTLIKIGKTLSHALTRERVCESCGSEFSCGANLRGCWCAEIDLSDQDRAELQKRFHDCLCRTCLEQLAKSESAKV